MKTTPMQLAILAVAGFGSLILLQVLAQYRSSEDFKSHLQSLKMQDLIPDIRMRRVAEENMEAIPAFQVVSEDSNDDGETDGY